MIPEWMDQKYELKYEESRGSGQNYLLKSLHQMKRAVCDELLTECYANQKGFMQKLDPRVKLLLTIGLIVIAGITRSVSILLGLWVLSLLLMASSRLPVYTLQKRIWGFIPLLSLLVALPGMFNIFIDGTPLLVLYQSSTPAEWWGIHLPASVFITRQGALAALFLFLRVGISFSLGVLLTLTTPVARLFKSLRVLGIPVFFVMILEMSCRYLLLLTTVSIEMYEARKMRTVGKLPVKIQREQVGSSIATLFARSMELAEEVHLAMLARGYTGEVVSGEDLALGKLDLAIILAMALFVLALLMEGTVFAGISFFAG